MAPQFTAMYGLCRRYESEYDAGDVFLANAAFACYQDGDVRRGYNGGFFYRAVQFRRIADYAEALFYFLYVG